MNDVLDLLPVDYVVLECLDCQGNLAHHKLMPAADLGQVRRDEPSKWSIAGTFARSSWEEAKKKFLELTTRRRA